MNNKKFDPVNVSSKFAICGLPIRLDSYKTCSFGCAYCFANNRKIMEFEKQLQVGDCESVQKRLTRIFEKNKVSANNFLDTLIASKYTWHCGGMSDPFQPCEKTYGITEQLIRITKKYDISILFSTKSADLYGAWDVIDPMLHTFQLSVTNVSNNKKLEPNVPSIDKRYAMYRRLKALGFKVGIRIQPFIPRITTTDIIDMFHDADHFTIEGLKLVPQNQEHKEFILKETALKASDFTQKGLLNLRPEIREKLYKPFVDKLKKENKSYSLADNDFHHLGNNYCCCGDALVQKSTQINNTFLSHYYGESYAKEQVDEALFDSGLRDCRCNQLFTSNRQGGCERTRLFRHTVLPKKFSVFSEVFIQAGARQFV